MPERRIEYLKLDDIVEWAENPKDHDIGAIILSIRRFGFQSPLLVNNRTGVLLAGHGRTEALRKMRDGGEPVPDGIQAERDDWLVPVVTGADLPVEEAEAYALADNRLVQLGGWHEDELARLLAGIGDVGHLTGLGWDEHDVAELVQTYLNPLTEEEEKFDVAASLAAKPEPRVRPGQVWKLRQHRLMCGDSTNEDDILRLMNGQRAILFATDPPWGIGYDSLNRPLGKGGQRPTLPEDAHDWDPQNAAAARSLYEAFINLAIKHAILPNAAWYCWYASRNHRMVEEVWGQHGAFFHQQIMWAKNRGLASRSWYMWAHEICAFGWIRGHRPPRVAQDHPPTVWQFDIVTRTESLQHPTIKPVEVFEIPMLQHTRPGEICYEPFCGSGSQVIAGEKLGRRVFGMEISPEYCEVAIQRWEHFTARKAERVE